MKRLHRSVLLNEVIEFIRLIPGGDYADLTFGEGGHTEKMLETPIKSLLGLDRDESALRRYQESGRFREDDRLSLIHGQASQLLEAAQGRKFDGILVDLGVSTRQLLEAERGFSLFEKGPLDMRMDTTQGPTLQDYLKHIDAEDLANELWKNTDLKASRSIARKILEAFHAGEIQNTQDLAAIIARGQPIISRKPHPATPTFLALRMAVNDEMGEVQKGIPDWIDALKPQGRLVVITFHSTEDRTVKKAFQLAAGRCICEKKICSCPRVQKVKILTPKPISGSEAELCDNPRARSAKLRCVEKI